MQQQSSEKVEEKAEVAVSTEIQQDVEEVALAVSALEAQNEDSNNEREQSYSDIPVKQTSEKEPEGRRICPGWGTCGQSADQYQRQCSVPKYNPGFRHREARLQATSAFLS